MDQKESVWEAARFAGDGYDRAQYVERFGFEPVSGWGRDGYDLGEWPYVMVFFRDRSEELRGSVFEVVVNVEGDAYSHEFPTAGEREAWVDDWAFREWKHHEREWVAGLEAPTPELRGRFSWRRLRRETCSTCREPLTPAEVAAVDADTDFIPHGDRGHKISREPEPVR